MNEPNLRVLLHSPVADHLLQPLIALAQMEGKRFFGGGSVPDELAALSLRCHHDGAAPLVAGT